MKNKYPGQCYQCNDDVPANMGNLIKMNGKWKVLHAHDCTSQESVKRRFGGRCEDAPCCGCCGGGNEYMSQESYQTGGYDW